MHVWVKPRPHTHTKRGLRFPPQYHNLNSQRRWGQNNKKKTPDFYVKNPFKVPGKEAPRPYSSNRSPWRETLRLHSFISVGIPQKEPSNEMRGNPTVTVHGAPRGRRSYIEWSAAWFPKRKEDVTFFVLPVTYDSDVTVMTPHTK